MSKNKTRATDTSVQTFLEAVANDTRRSDSYILLELMQKITAQPAVLWGTSIVGFGSYHYTYESGREGDMPFTGFSPRKQNLVLYNTGFVRYPELMQQLGTYKTGTSCLYINKLSDVHLNVLSKLMETAYQYLKKKHNG